MLFSFQAASIFPSFLLMILGKLLNLLIFPSNWISEQPGAHCLRDTCVRQLMGFIGFSMRNDIQAPGMSLFSLKYFTNTSARNLTEGGNKC